MENFIKLQNLLLDPKKSFEDFKFELLHSQINQFTYICLLLNVTATIKRPGFSFGPYLDLLTNFKNQTGCRGDRVNYMGYKDKISILMNACEKSSFSTVSLLASHPDIKLHTVDPNGFNAVFYAIRNPDENEGLRILEILYELSPQMIDTVTNNGYSPLFLAVEKLRIKIVDFLLKNQIDPNQKLFSNGNTPMHELMKLGSKYNSEEIKKMIEVFLRYNFDWGIKNNQDKTFQEYANDFRLNLNEILKDLRFRKPPQSEFGCELSETEAYSSHATLTKVEDNHTTYNYSELEENEFYMENDAMSVSNKSLLSEEVNHIHYSNQREYSLDMNLDQGEVEYDCYDSDAISVKIQDINHKMECQSQTNLANHDFEVSDDEREDFEARSQISESSESSDEEGESVRTEMINFEKNSKEILEFDELSQAMYISEWKQIESFFMKLHEVIQPLGLLIEVIGSFATGLWTHHSDIDIALVAVNQSYVDFERLLEKVFNKIKVRMYNMGIKQLSYNKASKIPSIKIEMDLHLFASRKIDIMIFHKKNMGITYVNYIREALNNYSYIRPIFFYLKKVCEEFNLHDPFNGGMKSYTIFLMIYSMMRPMETRSIAEVLLSISLYYGFYHEFQYEIQYRNINTDSFQYAPVPRLNITDPLNPKNNMGGKNTDVYKLKNMFRTIYYGMHKKINNGTTLQYILEMAKVVM